MKLLLILILLVVNIPVYKFWFRLFFRDTDDFYKSVEYSFTPDLFSLFRGRYIKDQIGEWKLSMFMFCCIGTIVFEFIVLGAIL